MEERTVELLGGARYITPSYRVDFAQAYKQPPSITISEITPYVDFIVPNIDQWGLNIEFNGPRPDSFKFKAEE